ncbi:hypothetical protein [Arthrobacter sp. AQ5-05]|uniref:hypothetical protein n=1 Tax=Arthrobacter sp. AQ5-05 TaxID=2184581 RepID=UPI000A7E5839|nr:hypothetical protein [Arthrobacter sp. AQ5-05]
MALECSTEYVVVGTKIGATRAIVDPSDACPPTSFICDPSGLTVIWVGAQSLPEGIYVQ